MSFSFSSLTSAILRVWSAITFAPTTKSHLADRLLIDLTGEERLSTKTRNQRYDAFKRHLNGPGLPLSHTAVASKLRNYEGRLIWRGPLNQEIPDEVVATALRWERGGGETVNGGHPVQQVQVVLTQASISLIEALSHDLEQYYLNFFGPPVYNSDYLHSLLCQDPYHATLRQRYRINEQIDEYHRDVNNKDSLNPLHRLKLALWNVGLAYLPGAELALLSCIAELAASTFSESGRHLNYAGISLLHDPAIYDPCDMPPVVPINRVTLCVILTPHDPLMAVHGQINDIYLLMSPLGNVQHICNILYNSFSPNADDLVFLPIDHACLAIGIHQIST